MKNFCLVISLLVAFNVTLFAQSNRYSFECKEGELVADVFRIFQEKRESKGVSTGTIFITPAIATRRITLNIKGRNIVEERVVAYLCKASNAAFYSDDFGNYYIISTSQTVNGLKEEDKGGKRTE